MNLLAIGLPPELANALSTRLSGVTVTPVQTLSEATRAARASPFGMIVASDEAAPLGDTAAYNELIAALGSGPFRLVYCTSAPSESARRTGAGDTIKAERIFFRPIDQEEMLREIARAIGVEVKPAPGTPGDAGAAGAQLAAIWKKFRGATLDRVEVLENAALALLENRLTEELRATATREAHKLAGSSGTFGFPRASQLAREIEQRFARGQLTPGDAVPLSEQLIQLRAVLEGEPVTPEVNQLTAATPSSRARILILEPDRGMRERLVMEAEGRCLSTVEAGDAGAARSAIAGSPVHAALIGLDSRGDGDDALDLVEEFQHGNPPIPTVVVAARGGLAERVEIARRGASRRLEYPVSPALAVDAVLAALREGGGAKPTILAVDDDAQILELMRTLLIRHGMRVETLGDPMLFWERLDATDPDLVILDIDMPQVSGIELCRALRNDERWTALPVLFMTARSDPTSIQRVFAAGADDYVGKPISESELVVRLNNRLERVRQLREQAETDPLTRLATRRKALELTERFVKLAGRGANPFSLALVDLDDLRAINSNYGHASGDDVLRSLAQLLARSLRAVDIIGRWGDDEFIIGFYASEKRGAATRLHTILAAFVDNEFRSEDRRTFHASFSAGVAQAPEDGANAKALIAAAQETLRQSIFDGGHKVRTAGSSKSDAAEYTDIALVEDDEALVGLVRHGFETAGFRVRAFGDGETAVAALGGETPALRARLIVLDVDLPGLNGYDVLRRLSKDGITKSAKVIMLTARNAEEDVLSALGLGALDHVNKPFSLPVLLQKVSTALKGAPG